MSLQYTHVFAVPGEQSIIDSADPDTGIGGYSGETLDQIRQRYPGAVLMDWADWTAAASARQQTPIVWEPTTHAQYMRMLEVLPPIDWSGGAFLVGEPSDHDFATGRPRYQAFREQGGQCFASSRPLTRAELRAELRNGVQS
jgi:hypothetical protein